ncbi:16S rRNA (cytosine(1402)-N(4))-methyltransferase RsmH [Candidatus Rhodoluna planktonica]|uniref:Ribosomal RNA small subunit methyltransferase H n=1 Tax=Candidatus Rhodoluna planktonica TaxID=535712 RepID=A0A1D9DZE3_9MICO|nr:16S rRNA (cytosine(1402)-N(4))-methyltransferase RsmH [Candidatus Rhodoluna planktonica]AOY56174.1 16S rRNA (cytosine(1402)-N(4))-methyltransferase [Candidatus Rhodoluna planktonica]
MKQINQLHKPVLLERCIELLAPALQKPGAVLVDGTLGLAGHAEAFLQAFPGLVLVGIDRDPKALELAAERLKTFADRTHLVHAVYDEIEDVLDELGIEYADAILLDLGVSSMQLDEGERGFAYSYDAPLDMRMDNTTGMTAADVLNTYNENDLVRIFRDYGEEKFAKPIARQIVATRNSQPFETSAQLSGLIIKVVPFIKGKSSGHPAKRVFQALRIEVNQELEVLRRTIPAAISVLGVGARIVVLSYHSLEDRIVKTELVSKATSSAPLGLPELPEHAPVLKLLVKGAESASDLEISENPRAASVKLRAAEKIRRAA